MRLLAFFLLLAGSLAASEDPLVALVRTIAAERGDPADASATLSSAPVSPAPVFVSAVRPPRIVFENPYIVRLAAGARASLATPETAADWPRLTAKNAPGFFVLQGSSLHDTRGTAARMEALLWLFANPASPLRHDPAVLAAFLRRAHTYADGITAASSAGSLKAGQLLLDDFAIAPASCAFREFAALYPGLLFPSQRAAWDRALRVAADAMMGKAAGRPGNYANIDLALSFQLLNFGLHLNDETLLARSRELFTAQAANILPDGGTHYIWNQNESPGYHDVVAQFIARTYEINGSEDALNMLRRLEWYGPVSVGRHGEYWTAPSWKHTWNGGEFATGGEAVVAVTGNPWVRGMLVAPSAGTPLRNWEQARAAVAWWRPDVAGRPLPDNYTLLDRNIVGPRAWYGRFNYAATLRDIPATEPGHATLMGAQMLRDDFSRGVLLMGVYPRVCIGGDRANPRNFAWLSSDLKSSLTVGREWSAFTASYQLHAFGSSTKGKTVPWHGRQNWLGLPDRIIGELEITPESSGTPSAMIESVIRLGTGGTVGGPAQTLRLSGPHRYTFGDLQVIVHASDFDETRTEITPFRLRSAPYNDIVFVNHGAVSAPRRCVVEIRPTGITNDATVTVVSTPEGLHGFRVAVSGKTFTLWANPGATAQSAPLLPPSSAVSLHASASASPVPPGQHVLQIESPALADHLGSWADFATLASRAAP